MFDGMRLNCIVCCGQWLWGMQWMVPWWLY